MNRPAVRREGGGRDIGAGTVLSDRYEIVQLLGQGGMGAVYKARDLELDRIVALKAIRSEFASDPKSLQRFKQEMILARQITHRNVVRIFDLGTHEGVKYITMEYLEGKDLAGAMSERRFTPQESARIVRQVCHALDAAHAEHVTHRDLKPQNIMLDSENRVRVMDFGLARSVEMTGITRTGAVLGTPAYMSPEQVQGATVDSRSDLYSLGLIFYELLTGDVPFRADTVWATLLNRTQGPTPAPVSVAPDTPPALNDIVVKCLQKDPTERYQTAADIAADLDAWLGDRTVASSMILQSTVGAALGAPAALGAAGTATPSLVSVPPAPPEAAPAPPKRRGKLLAAAIAIAVIAAGTFGWRQFSTRPAKPHGAVTLLIADISNHTGEPVFDGTLEPMLRMALEGAGFISAYDRTQLRNLGAPPATGKLDQPAARQIAVAHGVSVVLSGSLNKQGAGYSLSVTAARAITGEAIATSGAVAPSKDQVLFAVTKAAGEIRRSLGDDTSESAQRFAMDTLTATSLEAVHEYSQGMESLSSGKFAAARASFSKAADLDQGFGLAYTGMATASRNLGQIQQADAEIKLAMSHIDRMTERERRRTMGIFYAMTGDPQKCVDEYSALIARYSSDVAARNNLGVCYSRLRKWPEAIRELEKAAEILPKRAVYRYNLAQYRIYAGDFDGADRDLKIARQLTPNYEKGYLTEAYAELGKGRPDAAAAVYERLRALSPSGASMASAGLGDLAIYEGRFGDAVKILSQGAAADISAGKPDSAASKFALLAHAEAMRKQTGPAAAAARSALANSKAPKIRFLAGRILASTGDTNTARSLAADLEKEQESASQALGKILEGEIALESGDSANAVKLISGANALIDTWIGRFALGRAYAEAGTFDSSSAELARCIERRGESLELFMDDVPTYGLFPAALYWQGRALEGMHNPTARDTYRRYAEIRSKSTEDPLLTDVKRRAGL